MLVDCYILKQLTSIDMVIFPEYVIKVILLLCAIWRKMFSCSNTTYLDYFFCSVQKIYWIIH